MSSVVKSIGKAVKKVGKAIGKFVKKALPIIIIAAVIYFTGGAGAGVAAAGGGKAAAGAALATGAATSAGGVATTVGGISGAGGAGAVSGAVGGATSAAAPVASNALVGPEIAAAGGATGNAAQALGAVGSGTSGAAATGLGASTYSLPSAGAITKTPIAPPSGGKYLSGSQSWGANPINRGAAQGATQAADGVVTQSGLGTIGTSGGLQPPGITGASGLSETGASLMSPSANPAGTVTIKPEVMKGLVEATNVPPSTKIPSFTESFGTKVQEAKQWLSDVTLGRPVTNEAGQIISRQGGLLGEGGVLGKGGWVERNPAVSEMLAKGIGSMAQTAMAEEEYEPPREYFMTKPGGPPVSMEQARQLIGGQPTQPRGYLQSTPQQQMKKNQQLLRNTQLVPSPTAPQGY